MGVFGAKGWGLELYLFRRKWVSESTAEISWTAPEGVQKVCAKTMVVMFQTPYPPFKILTDMKISSNYFQGSYRDKFLPNCFRGVVRDPPPFPPWKRGSYRRWVLAETYFSGILFGALAGIFGKSPEALTE